MLSKVECIRLLSKLALLEKTTYFSTDLSGNFKGISKRSTFPSTNPSTNENFDFDGYVDRYGNLIMSVGVTIRDVVENKGIFRNPLTVVEGGYGGISMMTHCFTCMVVEANCPSVKIFKARPLKKMSELFLSSLPKDQITVNGKRGDL